MQGRENTFKDVFAHKENKIGRKCAGVCVCERESASEQAREEERGRDLNVKV